MRLDVLIRQLNWDPLLLRSCAVQKGDGHNCIAYKETSSFDVPEPVAPIEPVTQPMDIIKKGQEVKRKPSSKPVSQQNRMIIAGALIVVSVISVFAVILFATGPETLEGRGPATVDMELHITALANVNVYRIRNDLPELEYDSDITAQAFAEELASTGILEHNPDLDADTGENVARRTERGDPKTTIGLMTQDMVTNDESTGGANRANILFNGYTNLSVGVEVIGDTVYLVLNFN